MAVLYVVLALIIVITNITAVPAAIVTIVKSAFTGSALAGGAMGTMVVAMYNDRSFHRHYRNMEHRS